MVESDGPHSANGLGVSFTWRRTHGLRWVLMVGLNGRGEVEYGWGRSKGEEEGDREWRGVGEGEKG